MSTVASLAATSPGRIGPWTEKLIRLESMAFFRHEATLSGAGHEEGAFRRGMPSWMSHAYRRPRKLRDSSLVR